MSVRKNNQEPERRQVQVIIEEAAGKRIRQLVIQGPPDPDMNDFILLVIMARRSPSPRPGLVRLAGNVPADAPPRAFVLPAVCADPTLLPYTADTPGPCRPSSPHGSTAPGSCGSHSALDFQAWGLSRRLFHCLV